MWPALRCSCGCDSKARNRKIQSGSRFSSESEVVWAKWCTYKEPGLHATMSNHFTFESNGITMIYRYNDSPHEKCYIFPKTSWKSWAGNKLQKPANSPWRNLGRYLQERLAFQPRRQRYLHGDFSIYIQNIEYHVIRDQNMILGRIAIWFEYWRV